MKKLQINLTGFLKINNISFSEYDYQGCFYNPYNKLKETHDGTISFKEMNHTIITELEKFLADKEEYDLRKLQFDYGLIHLMVMDRNNMVVKTLSLSFNPYRVVVINK